MMLCEKRRPIAHRAQDLGIWFNILDAVAKIAVISNVRDSNSNIKEEFSILNTLYMTLIIFILLKEYDLDT